MTTLDLTTLHLDKGKPGNAMTATLQPDDLCDCPLIDAEHTADECQQLRLDIEDEDQQ